MVEKCWSLDGEEFFDDWCRLIKEIECQDLGEDAEYFEGDKAPCDTNDYLSSRSIDYLLDQMDEWVYNDLGWLESYDGSFSVVSEDAKTELQVLLQQWAEKYVSIPYWKVENVVEKVLTKGDLE